MSDDKDTEMLFPDQTISVGKEKITVHEFRYREGLDAAALAGPILADLRALMAEVGGEISPEALDQLIARHREIWLQLIAISCGRDIEWLAKLPDRNAMQIQIAFWGANSDFFMRRLIFGTMLAATIQERRSPSPRSSPN